MKQKLSLKDLITIGVFATVYFLLVAIVTFVVMVVFPGRGHFYLPAAVALVVGPIYFIIQQRVPKFGAITILSSVMGIFFMLGGYFPLAFLPSFICGGVADVLLYKVPKFKTGKEQLAYVIFSFGVFGPLLPLMFMRKQYIASLLAKGKSATYVNEVFQYVSPQLFVIAIVATIVCALIGGYFSKKFVMRNFSNR